MNFCIYKHENLKTGTIYIGFTNDVNKRWRYNGIGYSRHNKRFWNDIQKYSWDGFTHEILEDNLDEVTARQREDDYIQEYCENGYDLYNICKGGSGGKIWEEHPKGFKRHKHTVEWCMNHSEQLKNPEINPMCNGKVQWGITHPHPKGFLGHTHSQSQKEKTRQTILKNGMPNWRKTIIKFPDDTIKEYRNTKEAANDLQVSPALLKKIANSKVPYQVPKSAKKSNPSAKLEGIFVIIS